MTKKTLFVLWCGMFVLCAALGFVPEPDGAVRVLLTILAVLFFLPPAVLLYQARDIHTLLLVRNLSILSLSLTLLALIGNFLTALSSEALGTAVYYFLVIVSCPMICSGHWAMSLFLWACLLIASLKLLKQK